MNSQVTDSGRKVIIVGGGVIGAFAAYYLRRTGRDVTIVEQNRFGAACSHGNCGYVSPSHVQPLPRPGQILNGLKGLFSTQRALRIKPQLSPSFWMWMLNFASRCNMRDVREAGKARHALLQSSKTLYEQVIAEEKLQVDWTQDGLLFVYRDKHEFEAYRRTNEWLTREFGVAAEEVRGSDALTELEPALKPGLAGAWWYRIDSHLRPSRLMSELRRVLENQGVHIIEQTEVKGWTPSCGKATAVRTTAGEIAADEFVVCTGSWTPFLNDALGCRIPIQPGKGYSLTMPRPKRCPRYPMILEECHVAITPFADGYRVGSTMEFAGYDTTLNRKRLNYLRSGAAQYLHEPTTEPIEEEWYGWRPMTTDGKPYIDRAPAFNNVWVAAGHNMLGISMGTATGKLISELVTEQAPHIDVEPFHIGR
ncbi:MAG: FAD-dependent oxidoreductase [Planctomycetaceae bacterium]|nr:FAD-dependent oxidoreductase [Planctomycetaceae bacterium]